MRTIERVSLCWFVGILAFFGVAADPAQDASAAQVVFVKADASGSNNGSSWANAFRDLPDEQKIQSEIAVRTQSHGNPWFGLNPRALFSFHCLRWASDAAAKSIAQRLLLLLEPSLSPDTDPVSSEL